MIHKIHTFINFQLLAIWVFWKKKLLLILPEKKFYPLTKRLICTDMKLTTLPDVYRSLLAIAGKPEGEAFEILMDEEQISAARKCIDKMIALPWLCVHACSPVRAVCMA